MPRMAGCGELPGAMEASSLATSIGPKLPESSSRGEKVV